MTGRPRRARVFRTLRRVGVFLILFLVVEYLVLPQIAGARKALSLLSHVNLAFVVAAIALEAAAIFAYALLTRSVLPDRHVPGILGVLRIDLSTLGLSHVIPGGSAAGTGLGYRMLTASGVSGSDAGFALATQGIGSAVVLNALLWLGLVISIPLRGFSPLYGTAAIVGVILIGGFFGVVLLLTRGEARAARITRAVAGRVPFLDEDAIHRLVHRLAARLRTLLSDKRLLLRATGWAATNWLLDAASLWVFLFAFGHRTALDGLVVSYALANVLAAVPVTPGGLGVVEAVLTSSLVGFGVPRGIAILGVISYRLVNFWLPIPVGGVAYLSHRVTTGAQVRRRSDELRRLAEESLEQSEDLHAWAEEHGLAVGPDQPDATST